MKSFSKLSSQKANALLGFLFALVLLGVAGYIIYNNPDFQKKYRKEISRTRQYLRDQSRAIQGFFNKNKERIQDWKKENPGQPLSIPNPFAKKEEPKAAPTFADMAFDTAILSQEVPMELVRRQTDELIMCSFDANFLLAAPLTDKEVQHLANIMRFCDINAISNLKNETFLTRASTILKILRYNAAYSVSPPTSNKTISAFLYRTDRINVVKPARTTNDSEGLPNAPFFGTFRSGDFDFTLVVFQTPLNGFPLPTLTPLETVYETLKMDNADVKDVIIFGDFAFRSNSLIWDNGSLLPTMARLKKESKNNTDLLGNFWFRKKDLIEFNGNSGELNIKEDHFPSAKNLPPAYKPIWGQFKAMPDDD